MTRDALRTTGILPGVTIDEIIDLAIANIGIVWTENGCTDFVWGITNLAGAPFFDLRDLATAGDPTQPLNTLYVVPHSDGIKSSTDNVAGDGWTPVYAGTSVSALKAILQPGDVVRVYKAGNTTEDSLDPNGGYAAHSFIVVSVEAGDIQVVDNWNTTGIIQHSLSDITSAFAPTGDFEAAFVSRLDESYAAANFGGDLAGNGFGDFSTLPTDDFTGQVQIEKNGEEFEVNTASSFSSSYIASHKVVALDNGNFALAWEENSNRGVKFKLLGSQGQPLNSETADFESPDIGGGRPTEPTLASSKDGTVLLVWSQYVPSWVEDISGATSGTYEIFAQVISFGGESVRSTFLLNSNTTRSQVEPNAIKLSSGNYLVTWTSKDQNPLLGSGERTLSAKIIDAFGSAVSNEIQIASDTFNGKHTTAASNDGGFYSFWVDNGAIVAKKYSAQGDLSGGEITVDARSLGVLDIEAASMPDGRVILVSSEFQVAGDEDQSGVVARIFNPLTGELEKKLRVNSETISYQVEPAIALVDKGFLVSWSTKGSEQDTSGFGVNAQLFDFSSERIGEQFLLNSKTEGDQGDPSITTGANDKILAVWRDLGNTQSGDRPLVKGQFLELVDGNRETVGTRIFSDDFNRPDSETVGNGWVEVQETLASDPVFTGSSTFNIVSGQLEVDFDAEGVSPARLSTYKQPYMTRDFGANLGDTGFDLAFSFTPGDEERVRHFVGLADSGAGQIVADQADGRLLIPASGIGIELGRSGSDFPQSSVTIWRFSGDSDFDYENKEGRADEERVAQVQLPFSFENTDTFNVSFSVETDGAWRIDVSNGTLSEEYTGTMAPLTETLDQVVMSTIEAGHPYYGNQTEIVKFDDLVVYSLDAVPAPELPDLTAFEWDLSGIDEEGNTFEGDLVFEIQEPTESGYTLGGYFDWIANETIEFRVLFDGIFENDGDIFFENTRLEATVEGIAAANYWASFNADFTQLIGNSGENNTIPLNWQADRIDPTNQDPVASGMDRSVAAASIIPLAELFTWSDPDGPDDIVSFAVRDRTDGSGYLTRDGIRQTDGVLFDEQPIGDIDRWAFVAGASGESDEIGFNAIDAAGAFNSPSALATVTANPPAPPENEAPSLNLSQSLAVLAGETFVYDFNATDDRDAESDGLFYSTTGGADQNAFVLDGITGELSLKFPAEVAPFSDANGDGVYEVSVKVTDSNGLLDSIDTTIAIIEPLAEWNAFVAQLRGSPIANESEAALAVATVSEALFPLYKASATARDLFAEIVEKDWKPRFEVFNGIGSEYFPSFDLVSIGLFDTNRSYFALDGSIPQYTSLGTIIFHELVHFVDDKNAGPFDKAFPEVEDVVKNGSINDKREFFANPESDHLGSAVTATNLVRQDLGLIERGSYYTDLGTTSPASIQRWVNLFEGNYDQAIPFFVSNTATTEAFSSAPEIESLQSNDLIIALNGSNLVRTGAGDDTILFFNSISDVFEGGSGNDTYIASGGGGSHIISDISGFQDRLIIDAQIDFSLTRREASDLVIINEFGSSIRVKNHYSDDGQNFGSGYIDSIQYSVDPLNGFSIPIQFAPLSQIPDSPAYLLGSASADEILTGSLADTIRTGGGADVIRGSLEALSGDVIEDFSEDDRLVFVDTLFSKDALTVTLGSAILDIDVDLDGVTDATVTLLGDFEGSEFRVSQQDGNTLITVLFPPDAKDDVFTVDEDTVLAGNVLADNGNGADEDPDNDPLTVALVSGPSNGSLLLGADGAFSYDPDTNFNGSDSFTYDISNGQGGTDTASVTVAVNAVNDAPVGVDDAYSTAFETTLNIAATGVLVNDTDVEGDALSAILDAGPSNGSLTLNPDGGFDYTPDTGFSGTDTFTYFANDGTDSAATAATVTITVEEDEPELNIVNGTAGRDYLIGTSEDDLFLFRGGFGDAAVGAGGNDRFDLSENLVNGLQDNTRIFDWSDGDLLVGIDVDDVNLATVRSSSTTVRFAYGEDNDVLTITGDVGGGLESFFDIV